MTKNAERTMERILNVGKRLQMRTPENSSEDVVETCQVLDKALALQAFRLDKSIKDVDNQLAQPPFCSGSDEYCELRQIYETYFGMTATLDERFDIDYLVSIPLMVLYSCLPVVRRADYLVENGRKTTVTALRDSIVVPVVMPSSGELFFSDIKCWQSRRSMTLVAPYSSTKYRQVSQGRYESMEFLDTVVTNVELSPFMENRVFPKYKDSKHRYFDNLTKCPAVFEGYDAEPIS